MPVMLQVDMITPMCSQLTYEGLIDEVMHRRRKYRWKAIFEYILRSVPIYGHILGGLIFLCEQNSSECYICKASYTKYVCCDGDFILDFLQFLGVNNGAVDVDSSIMGVQQDGKKIKVPLNSRFSSFFHIPFQHSYFLHIICILYVTRICAC